MIALAGRALGTRMPAAEIVVEDIFAFRMTRMTRMTRRWRRYESRASRERVLVTARVVDVSYTSSVPPASGLAGSDERYEYLSPFIVAIG